MNHQMNKEELSRIGHNFIGLIVNALKKEQDSKEKLREFRSEQESQDSLSDLIKSAVENDPKKAKQIAEDIFSFVEKEMEINPEFKKQDIQWIQQGQKLNFGKDSEEDQEGNPEKNQGNENQSHEQTQGARKQNQPSNPNDKSKQKIPGQPGPDVGGTLFRRR